MGLSFEQAVQLERTHNAAALDPETIKPWVFESSHDTLQERYRKINIGMLLAMRALSNLKEAFPDLRDNEIAKDMYEYIQFDVAQVIDDQRDIMRMLER